MFHACFISTFLCFVDTLEYFYTFFGTNLLTRCHSAIFLFFDVFGFRKASKEIFSELDRTKAKVNILPEAIRRPKRRWSGARGRPHLVAARPRGVAPLRSFSVSSFGSVFPSVKYWLWLLSRSIPRIFIFWLSRNQNSRKQAAGTVASC